MVPIIVSLFDRTTIALKPWVDAGAIGVACDIQHPPGTTREGGVIRVGGDIETWQPGELIKQGTRFVSAFPPCDHLASSGARWWAGKGLRLLSDAIRLVAVAAEFCEEIGAPYYIENPIGALSTHWRKPDYKFSPHEFQGYTEIDENYTKTTCLWTGGGFVMPPTRPSTSPPDQRIHRHPGGPGRKNFRSRTPDGFARAVFEANRHLVFPV